MATDTRTEPAGQVVVTVEAISQADLDVETIEQIHTSVTVQAAAHTAGNTPC